MTNLFRLVIMGTSIASMVFLTIDNYYYITWKEKYFEEMVKKEFLKKHTFKNFHMSEDIPGANIDIKP